MSLLDAIYSVSQAWSSMDPETLIQSQRNLLPDLEEDMQVFADEEISKSEILYMVCDMRSAENIDKGNTEE